jgi:hypothetical protein
MADIDIASFSTNSHTNNLRGPLVGLSKTLGMSTLSYPLELGTDDSKKHYVTFLAKEITPQNFFTKDSPGGQFVSSVGGATLAVGSALAAQGELLAAKGGRAFGEATKLETDGMQPGITNLQTDADEKANIAGKEAKGVADTINQFVDIRKNRIQVKSYISLYMPDTLQATYHADYASISMRDELGQQLQKIRAIGSIAGSGLEGLGSEGGALNAVGSNPQTVKYVIDSFARMFGAGENLSAGILQTQGYTSNPQLQMIYQGASFRTFTLNFVFTPKSKQEALAVENIIYQFKYYAAPTLQTPGQSPNASMFLTPPALFEVRFYYDGNENKHLPRYTDCVLEDISVDYAPNGFAAHTDGAPIQTQLTLSFHEVEIVDKARLQAGFNSRASGLR